MDWFACLLMSSVLLMVAFIIATIVITIAIIISGARRCRYVEVLRITMDAFAFVPSHIALFSITLFVTVFYLLLLLGYAVVIVLFLCACFAGFLYATIILFFLWYMVMGTSEKRASHKHELATLLNQWKDVAVFGGRGYSRFCAQLLSVVIGCTVAWWAYVSVLTPIRLHVVKDVLEKRFDGRLSGTAYHRRYYNGKKRSFCRDVMRKVITDDWRLQLACGDIPIDWLLDGIGDLERRVDTICPVDVIEVKATQLIHEQNTKSEEGVRRDK